MSMDVERERELKRQDRLHVRMEVDGTELTVYNWVTVGQVATARGTGTIEYTRSEVHAGDSTTKPDAVTHWVAHELVDEFGIDPAGQGIAVIDPTDDGVTVL